MTEVLIDGVTYSPGSGPSIGVGVTTHNRSAVLADTVARIHERTPGARVVVVDDASKTKVPADFRFAENVGIARAKNKCLELLQGCEHIFLFDDDCYPKVDGWWKPYVESPEPHLMYLFLAVNGRPVGDSKLLYADSDHTVHSHERGPMLYLHRSAIDRVGGFDVEFGKWGREHGDLSNRIHAAGLTTWRYADVTGSSELIHSMDEHGEIERSVPKRDRQANEERFQAQRDLPLYREYRDPRDVVLACYFTGKRDPQRRDRKWKTDTTRLEPLLKSIQEADAVVLHNDLPDRDGFERVEQNFSPYYQRWLSEYQWLRQHPEVRWVWLVDSTDVEMLRSPFGSMEPGVLYVGSEVETTDKPWLTEKHPRYRAFCDEFACEPILNCGLVGGDRGTVLEFLADLNREIFDALATDEGPGDTEMGAFNFVLRSRWQNRFFTGPRVHTVFKANKPNDCSWWKHK